MKRQIGSLRALEAARQGGKRKCRAFTLDLDADAVNRILDAVDKHRQHVPETLRTEESRFEELRHELSCARWTFADLRLGEREPTVSRKRKALEALTKAARRFCNAVDSFDGDGRLGWLSVCVEGAERHRLEVEQDLARIQSEGARLDLKKRGAKSYSDDEREELGRRRDKLTESKIAKERLLFAYQDYGPEGILHKARLTADAVASWLPAAERLARENKTSIPEMLASAGDEGHLAMRWLIGDKLREVYERFVDRKYSWASVWVDGQQKADSPAIRFALQTIREFEITNERGNDYTADAIKNYWPKGKSGRPNMG